MEQHNGPASELAGYTTVGDFLDRHAGPFFQTRSSFDWFIQRNRGVGNTLLAQMIGSALALGVHFIDEITRPFKVLFWGCEDDLDEFWRRPVLIGQHFGVGMEAFNNLIIVPRLGLENTIVSAEYSAYGYQDFLKANDIYTRATPNSTRPQSG